MVALNCVYVAADPFLVTGAIAKSADVAPKVANSIIIFVMRCAFVFMKSGTRYMIRIFFCTLRVYCFWQCVYGENAYRHDFRRCWAHGPIMMIGSWGTYREARLNRADEIAFTWFDRIRHQHQCDFDRDLGRIKNIADGLNIRRPLLGQLGTLQLRTQSTMIIYDDDIHYLWSEAVRLQSKVSCKNFLRWAASLMERERYSWYVSFVVFYFDLIVV